MVANVILDTAALRVDRHRYIYTRNRSLPHTDIGTTAVNPVHEKPLAT